MHIVIDIPNVPIQDYSDLYYKIYGMAASEGLFDDKEKSQRALALKAVLDVLSGVVNGTPLPKGHGRLVDVKEILDAYENSYKGTHADDLSAFLSEYVQTVVRQKRMVIE